VICFACSVLGILLPESEESGSDSTATNEPAIATDMPATATDIPATAIMLSPEDALEESVREALGDLNREGGRIQEIDIRGDNNDLVSVRFSLNDNFSEDAILRSGMLDIIDILKAVDSSSVDYSIVIVEGTFLMVDTFGNESEDVVMFASYSKENIAKIKWDSFITDNIFVIAETHRLHPAFEN
jgi:hypothetical protein